MGWFGGNNGGHDAIDEGQEYLVSVSDIMSGLLFIFIVTLMVYVINFQDQSLLAEESKAEAEKQHILAVERQVKAEEQRSEAKRETDQLIEIQKRLTDAKQVRKRLLEDLKQSMERHGVRVRIDTERGLLHVPEDILFESGRAEFQPGGKESLSHLAANLAERLPCYSGKRGDPPSPACSPENYRPGRIEAVFIEGHTDNVPIRSGKFEDNWDLSVKRAIITYRFMLQQQAGLGEIVNGDGEPLLGVSGYADTRPVIRHAKIQAEPFNRRIDLRFILAPPEVRHADRPKG